MDSELLKIGELAELSGVLPVTLRAWERRYGLLKPQRTPKGHRLYPRSELDKVAQIRRYLGMGVGLADIKALLAGISEPKATPLARPLLALAQSLKVQGLRHSLDQFLKEQPLDLACGALWQQLEQWPPGPFSAAAKGLLEAELSQRLAAICRLQQQSKKPLALLAGKLPPLWRLMVAAVLSHRHNLVDLGEALDGQELTLACAALAPEACFLGACKGELPPHRSVLPGAFNLEEAP
ncbi:MerR family transcriptional regulator [Gallaecimonas kandeliae]|uniref:MerR family transcriptional regulator n=1 Tax=Gallaecimonas kandeliae TaxID=3029055 RepID=UPI00264A1274|nr:MerR family transcriptional regulator [Gallaecimonas kandeliae]WKE63946.1 MerR family transcriptional regulator [Gallaecimonas kandeliae]